MEDKRTYLGDGVYVEWKEGMIKLTTDHGHGITNTIYLENYVYIALRNFYRKKVQAEAERVST